MHIKKDDFGAYVLYEGRDVITRISEKELVKLVFTKFMADNPNSKIVPVTDPFMKMTMQDTLVKDIRYHYFNFGIIQAVRSLRTQYPILVLKDAKEIVEYFAAMQKYQLGE